MSIDLEPFDVIFILFEFLFLKNTNPEGAAASNSCPDRMA